MRRGVLWLRASVKHGTWCYVSIDRLFAARGKKTRARVLIDAAKTTQGERDFSS
jgi:hypothetical protein|tara:strand:- start:4561 stop:4722 length:162 start_codon:yes stop_codon:yes gene_type:complete